MIGSNLVLAILAVCYATGNPIVAGMMAASAVIMSAFVLNGSSYLRMAGSVYVLALVWVLGWIGLRSLGIVP